MKCASVKIMRKMDETGYLAMFSDYLTIVLFLSKYLRCFLESFSERWFDMVNEYFACLLHPIGNDS